MFPSLVLVEPSSVAIDIILFVDHLTWVTQPDFYSIHFTQPLITVGVRNYQCMQSLLAVIVTTIFFKHPHDQTLCPHLFRRDSNCFQVLCSLSQVRWRTNPTDSERWRHPLYGCAVFNSCLPNLVTIVEIRQIVFHSGGSTIHAHNVCIVIHTTPPPLFSLRHRSHYSTHHPQ